MQPEDIERLLRLEHAHPHTVLGAHQAADGMVVRAYRPDADRVRVLLDGASRTGPVMTRRDGTGLFEARIEGTPRMPAYRLELELSGGTRRVVHDPYSFEATLGELDLHLVGEGRHQELYRRLGAHVRELRGVRGVSFAVWAPAARAVSVVGDWNSWDGRLHMMRSLGSTGIWEIFIPELEPGAHYKYEICTAEGARILKTDPFASAMEQPPGTASLVYESRYRFGDAEYLAARAKRDPWHEPVSIYELHLDSFRRIPEEGDRPLTYRELAPVLADYVTEMGFTHVELLPVQEHPFTGSWGYQVSGYFAPTARYGTPDDFRFFVDHLHQRGIGVIIDWVPAHFPKDAFALGRFDGSALYEHVDPRQGEHPDWGTYIFNYDRREVRNFLLASALYWLSEYHIDGLRVDAVASMLYLDYSRNEGEWVPNQYGGRENLGAITFLRELNELAHERHPGIIMAAEESTAWPGVSRPTYLGGLGFGFKWNMGWMHDTLSYFEKDPIHRRYHHHSLTFGLLYAFSENFILPLSHDEVVHGKHSLIDKMPGDLWQRLANLRALYALMWAHPGKKLLFMGGEFAQFREWSHERSLDWHLCESPEHAGVQHLVRDLNRLYRDLSPLFEADFDSAGFQWIQANNTDDNVIAFMRTAPQAGRRLVVVGNFSPVVRRDYRVGVPHEGYYRELLNTDAAAYGGSNVGNDGGVQAEAIPSDEFPCSLGLALPPLGMLWLEVPDAETA